MHTIVICKTFYVCEELLVSNAFAILAPAVGAKTFFLFLIRMITFFARGLKVSFDYMKTIKDGIHLNL